MDDELAVYEDEYGEEIVLCDEHAERRRMSGQYLEFVDNARSDEYCADCEDDT